MSNEVHPYAPRMSLARFGWGRLTHKELVDNHRRELGKLDDELLARLDELADPLVPDQPKKSATEDEASTFFALKSFQRSVRAAHSASLRAFSEVAYEESEKQLDD